MEPRDRNVGQRGGLRSESGFWSGTGTKNDSKTSRRRHRPVQRKVNAGTDNEHSSISQPRYIKPTLPCGIRWIGTTKDIHRPNHTGTKTNHSRYEGVSKTHWPEPSLDLESNGYARRHWYRQGQMGAYWLFTTWWNTGQRTPSWNANNIGARRASRKDKRV